MKNGTHQAQKIKNRQFDNFVVTVGTTTCNDNLRWHHWQQSCQIDGVSNHQPHDCLLNGLFKAQIKKHQSSASLAFVRGIHWWPVNSPCKGPETRKMLPFDDVIMGRIIQVMGLATIVDTTFLGGVLLHVESSSIFLILSYFHGKKQHNPPCDMYCVRNKMTIPHLWCRNVM